MKKNKNGDDVESKINDEPYRSRAVNRRENTVTEKGFSGKPKLFCEEIITAKSFLQLSVRRAFLKQELALKLLRENICLC